MATFSNELLRRIKTTQLGVSQEDLEEILKELMDDLTAMGYTSEWREKVLKAATVGYMRILDKVSKGEGPRNRRGSETLMARRFKKLIGIQEWFRVESGKPDAWEIQEPWENTGRRSKVARKRMKDNRYIESVFFIPHTPESTLRNRLTKLEQNLGFNTRFRFVESMGRSLRE